MSPVSRSSQWESVSSHRVELPPCGCELAGCGLGHQAESDSGKNSIQLREKRTPVRREGSSGSLSDFSRHVPSAPLSYSVLKTSNCVCQRRNAAAFSRSSDRDTNFPSAGRRNEPRMRKTEQTGKGAWLVVHSESIRKTQN